MNAASPSPLDVDLRWARPGSRGLAEAFLADRLPRLEERLAKECAQLGGGLGPLGDVLERAVGTRGHGGGRWRPLLALAASEACGGRPGAALDVAVAVELTHTASLALDDLPCMDDSPSRRGQPATHVLVGSAGAILLSVGLLARAVELLGRQPSCGAALAAEWGRTVGLAGMAGGQAMDVAASRRALRGPQRRLHRAKSSALPAFALSSGARTAGADEVVRAGLEAFGRGLGWAYQIHDDVVDAEEDGLARAPGRRPLSYGSRIMRLAVRRLGELPGLSSAGLEILLGLAGRVVPAHAPRRRATRAAREGRS